MNKLIVGATCVGMLCAGQAQAGGPGEQGQLAVGAERLTGFTHTRQTSEDEFGKTTTTSNNFSLLSKPLSGFLSAYGVPRVALDYFVVDGLSLGGSIGYSQASFKIDQEPTMGGASDTESDISVLTLAPRVGYALMFSDVVGLWPRVGLTYMKLSSSNDSGSESTNSVTALGLEAPVLIAPVENVAITLGPTVDIGLSASGESTDSDGNTTEDDEDAPHEFGVQGGITVFF